MHRLTSLLLLGGLLTGTFSSCEPTTDPKPKPDPTPIVDPTKADPLPNFLFLSDVHLNHEKKEIISAPGGYCNGLEFSDTGTDLWDETKAELKKILNSPNKPQFILCTGDLPSHQEPINDPHNIPEDLGQALNDLREIAQANCTPFVYAPGNNDGLGGDYHSFENAAGEPPFVADTGYADQWPNIVPAGPDCPEVKMQLVDASHLDMGYYSAYPLGADAKLRVISLNTVIFVHSKGDGSTKYVNDHGPDQMTASFAQLEWMDGQLTDATQKGESIILMMHIPPGNDYNGGPNWIADEQDGKTILQTFLDAVAAAPSIAGILYGHTHKDELKLLYDSEGNFTELAISSPGITPQHCNNPGFKTVTYDPAQGYAFTEFTTYWSDFFTTKSAQPFKQAYTFSESYHQPIGKTMYDHLDSLNDTAPDSIIAGMAQTFNVKNGTALTDAEGKSIWVKYSN